MKTEDNSFQGFPGCWNMVVLVLFAVKPAFWVILVHCGGDFGGDVPAAQVHPPRADETLAAVSLPIAVAWTFFAGWVAWVDFHPESWAIWGLVGTSLYLLFAGMVQQIVPAR